MQSLEQSLLHDIIPVEAFQQMSAFGALSDHFVEKILAGGELFKLEKGEILYHQGESAECFYVVLKGHVEIYQDTGIGRKVIRTTNEGESVGFPAMLAMRPRLFNGVAIAECIALKITCQFLFGLHELDSSQFEIFFMNVSRDMSRFMSDCAR
ncbi:cyclic nucleotide-binding domain-containing protein [Pseudomonas aeruginosa]